jgi:ABC-type transporter Mla MlaB component
LQRQHQHRFNAAMLKIERFAQGSTVVFVLSGRIRTEDTAELVRALSADIGATIVVDLRHVGLVDRDGVRLLARLENDGVGLTNCPAYVREWMATEGE